MQNRVEFVEIGTCYTNFLKAMQSFILKEFTKEYQMCEEGCTWYHADGTTTS